MDVLVRANDVSGIREYCAKEKEAGRDDDLLIASIDRSIRMMAIELATNSDGSAMLDAARNLLNTAIELSVAGVASKTIAVSAMQDLFELSCVARCKQFFGILEERIDAFKEPPLVDACQSFVLRLCNDILRRLSRCVETSFSGRILFFLSRFLPVNEKSALNLSGHFNTANVTKFDTFESDDLGGGTLATDEATTGETKPKESNIPVDHALYAKFWQLQQFFCNPPSCYDKVNWKILQRNCPEVLNVLASYKLERPNTEEDKDKRGKRKRPAVQAPPTPVNKSTDQDTFYFAKYLTNPKLLQLQLNDSQFRRHFITQCLILFQYLLTNTKFKTYVSLAYRIPPSSKNHVLTDEETKFVTDLQEKSFKLLKETHPRGSQFAESVKLILEREGKWSEWKNQGCPDMASTFTPKPVQMFKKRPRIVFDPTEIDLGSTELTKLWKQESDIMVACRDPKRCFTPKMKEFLSDPLLEMDPEQQVEEQYKSVYDAGFQWRAARLLLHEDVVFGSSNGNVQTMSMPSFLETTMLNAARGIPELANEVAKAEHKKPKKDKEKEKREPLPSSLVSALAERLHEQPGEVAVLLNISKERREDIAKKEENKVEVLTSYLNEFSGSVSQLKQLLSNVSPSVSDLFVDAS